MKKIVCIMLLAFSLNACKKDCRTCPENYVLKNEECECESGVVIQGECKSKNFLRENNYYIQESTSVCEGFEGIENYEFVHQTVLSSNSTSKISLLFYGSNIINELGVVYTVGSDSLKSSRYADLGLKGISYKNNGYRYFEKEINGEICYLRCNIKIESARHMKYYFYFANIKDERKSEYCVRHFYQP